MQVESGLVSVIMPAYNCEEFIEDAISSVLRQTYVNLELIIVNDCSVDCTESIVQQYIKKDNRIVYKKLLKNSGAAVTRNEGLKMAKGEYIAFLDSDDLWMEKKLEEQISFMKRQNCLVTCTGYGHIDENGKSLNVAMIPFKKVNYNKMLFLADPVGNSTVVYNRSKVGEMRVPIIRKRNDFALWLKILKDVDYIYGMEDVLCNYRVRSNSISSNKISLIPYQWNLYRNIEQLPIIKAAIALFTCIFIKVTGIGRKKVKMNILDKGNVEWNI